MQLAELLARLSPDERATMLDRRLGPNAVPLDNHALAAQLATSASTSAALAQINGGQVLLLRWLRERKSLSASWSEIISAVGTRLTPEQLTVYLNDLRLWALADYDPHPKNGFFALVIQFARCGRSGSFARTAALSPLGYFGGRILADSGSIPFLPFLAGPSSTLIFFASFTAALGLTSGRTRRKNAAVLQ